MILGLEICTLLLVLVFIGIPFFGRDVDSSVFVKGEDERKGDLMQKKEYAYMTLRDLELDYRTNKISEEDYCALKLRYEAEAIEVLRNIDHIEEVKDNTEK